MTSAAAQTFATRKLWRLPLAAGHWRVCLALLGAVVLLMGLFSGMPNRWAATSGAIVLIAGIALCIRLYSRLTQARVELVDGDLTAYNFLGPDRRAQSGEVVALDVLAGRTRRPGRWALGGNYVTSPYVHLVGGSGFYLDGLCAPHLAAWVRIFPLEGCHASTHLRAARTKPK